MKNLLITAMLMITSFVALSQSIELGRPNRFFPQNQVQPYFGLRPDRFQGPREYRGIQLPLPDSIYMKNGKVVMIFDTQKLKQFILNKHKRWMKL